MNKRDDVSIISIRKCDLNSVLSMMSLGNEKLMESAWKSIEDFANESGDEQK